MNYLPGFVEITVKRTTTSIVTIETCCKIDFRCSSLILIVKSETGEIIIDDGRWWNNTKFCVGFIAAQNVMDSI